MARLIVDAECAIAYHEKRGGAGETPTILVSVSNEDGKPTVNLKISDFKMHGLEPPHFPPILKSFKVMQADENQPGLYLLRSNLKGYKPGKYLLAITVSQGVDRGRTLMTLVV